MNACGIFMRIETISTVIDTQPQATYAHAAQASQADTPEAWTMIVRPQRNRFDLRLGKIRRQENLPLPDGLPIISINLRSYLVILRLLFAEESVLPS